MNVALLSLALLVPAAEPNDSGVLPVGADGKPLNLDFETGTLKDWTAEGEAFRDQPIKGDAVAARRGDMKSRHQGQYWIGGYERHQDKPTGTLTSVPFKVTHPWASFLVGGGPHQRETCVELIELPEKKVFFSAAGLEEEDMKRVVVDLAKYQGKEIQVRLVDRHTGHWGHLNFDDFRFHTAKPTFPDRPRAEAPAKRDEYRYAGLPPEKAAAAMTVPEGFTVSLFASEPDVHQPVAMCIDDRGRLWIAEAYAYPRRLPFPGPLLPDSEKKKGDRILIFEDTDGDGKFDRRTVFIEGLNLVSGIDVGFGGVWVGAAPYLMFIPDKDRDDNPDGPPEVLLDGWGYQDTHETLNSFIWGPDGWLYGCHGVFTHSRVGKPGTPDKDRVPLNAAIWRYHPTRHVFEIFSEGTSNPWGLDYNDVGEFFIEACVIPHCFHMIQGGRYQRQAGQHFNPYTFADIQTIADHRHYVGGNPHGGNERSDSAGGGHAHCGLMCYLGGAWPKEYRGELFMGNIHGRRINVDSLKPTGSGYVASHRPDFLLANDAWARFINLRYGPDGNVYLIDWYDKQACHNGTPEIWDRTNGRVYKISYRGTKPVVGLDLQKCSDEELVKHQLSENDWYVRHARRVLQERASKNGGKLNEATRKALARIVLDSKEETRKLRGLWALGAADSLRVEDLPGLLESSSPYVTGWTIRLLGTNSGVAGRASFNDPVVRRYVVSSLARRPLDDRWEALQPLLSHAEDAADPNLPFLYWYALEPLVDLDTARALKTAAAARVPQLLPFTARKIGMRGTPEAIGLLVAAAGQAGSAGQQLAILQGIQEGLKGRRQFPMPSEWATAFPVLMKSENADVRNQVQSLAVLFGDKNAFAALRKVVADVKAPAAARSAALTSLIDARDVDVVPVLQGLLADPALRGAALRGLAAFDDPKTPGVILAAYPMLSTAEKRDALATLAARPTYAKALMAAVGEKKVPTTEVSAETVRQLRNLGDKELDKQVADLWGTVRETPAERKKLIEEWKRKLTTAAGTPDVNLGRAVFARTCQQCHMLYGLGGKVGPDITGSNRANLDYLLENILDPSAVIPREYAATRLALADGRIVTGIVKEETKVALTVVTATETVTIPVGDVDSRKLSDLSMMPDDVVKQLSELELRALVAYLQNPAQVPMLATPENAKDFFNGKDLTGWNGDRDVWSVENGEIIGRTRTGLKKNTFLQSQVAVEDFKLTLKVKLTPDGANSGVQFRSEPLPDGEMRGPQADIGAGWWGKLYEESGRGLLVKEGGEKHVKPGEWNDYAVEARGSRVKIWINGQLVCDHDDPKLSRRGIVGLQVHSGGPTDVRFKEIRLEVFK